jgi:Sec-independent protein translocase protein TatA
VPRALSNARREPGHAQPPRVWSIAERRTLAWLIAFAAVVEAAAISPLVTRAAEIGATEILIVIGIGVLLFGIPRRGRLLRRAAERLRGTKDAAGAVKGEFLRGMHDDQPDARVAVVPPSAGDASPRSTRWPRRPRRPERAGRT